MITSRALYEHDLGFSCSSIPRQFLEPARAFKNMGNEYFVAISVIKAFDKCVLLRFIGLDKFEINAFFCAPAGNDSRA